MRTGFLFHKRAFSLLTLYNSVAMLFLSGTNEVAGAASTLVGKDEEHSLINLVNYLSNKMNIAWFFVAIILTVLFILLAKLLSWIFKRSFLSATKHHPKFTPVLYSLVHKTVSVLIWIIAILSMLQCWGINLTPILAGLGITGIVLGFALQESVSSFFSGLMLAINNPFRIGDWVDIGGVVGTVMAMDAMCVTLASPDNKKIVLNNKNVWGNTIVNFSFTSTRRVDMTVAVEYGSDLDKTREVILGLLKSYKEVLDSPETMVEVGNYSNYSIDFIARPWVLPKDYWTVYWRFHGQILGELQRNGIYMPYNQVDVHIVSDGNSQSAPSGESQTSSSPHFVNEIKTDPPKNWRPAIKENAKGMGTKDPDEEWEHDKSQGFFGSLFGHGGLKKKKGSKNRVSQQNSFDPSKGAENKPKSGSYNGTNIDQNNDVESDKDVEGDNNVSNEGGNPFLDNNGMPTI